MGVFQIINKTNGKILIGSSNNLPAILNRFRAELKMGNCRNIVLQEEWKKYGPKVFEFKELEVLKPLDDPGYNPAEDLHILEELNAFFLLSYPLFKKKNVYYLIPRWAERKLKIKGSEKH